MAELITERFRTHPSGQLKQDDSWADPGHTLIAHGQSKTYKLSKSFLYGTMTVTFLEIKYLSALCIPDIFILTRKKLITENNTGKHFLKCGIKAL